MDKEENRDRRNTKRIKDIIADNILKNK